MLDGIEYAEDPYACAEGADALVIVTEWDAFRALDLERIRDALKQPILVDLRNIYRPDEMRQSGWRYIGVGINGTSDGVLIDTGPLKARRRSGGSG